MESKLNGLAISKGVSTDDVVRTIQALISAGYKGNELLDKIDEIYGVGARNNLLKTIKYPLPTSRTTIVIEYPEIYPSEKTKIGDILLGTNGYIGQITEVVFDSSDIVSSVTILGLQYSVISASDEIPNMISITYNDLVLLKNSGNLSPGMQYRIVDYLCKLNSVITEAEVINHPFDIIVTADSENELNENARACLHDGDDYYSVNRSNLSAWELKYCLDNDTNKFDWANSAGTGVVYFLKDDYGNECPYDFKQIKFETHRIDNCAVPGLIGKYCPNLHINNVDKIEYSREDIKYLFTFSRLVEGEYVDGSVVNDSVKNLDGTTVRCQNNVIKECHRRTLSNVQYLNSIVLVYDNYPVYSNYFDFDCADMMLCDSSHENTFGKFSFGNAFGKNYSCNTCDRYFYYNLFGNNCCSNVFSSNCANITFGNHSTGNIVENSCSGLSFGNYCENNTFKSGCNNIEFRTTASEGNLADRFSNNIIDNGNCYMILWSGTGLYPVKNYIFLPGIAGTINNKEVIELTRNLNYCTFVGQCE